MDIFFFILKRTHLKQDNGLFFLRLKLNDLEQIEEISLLIFEMT